MSVLSKFYMFCKSKSLSSIKEMDCCSCFGFISKPKRTMKSGSALRKRISQEFLLNDNLEDEDSYNGEATDTPNGSDGEARNRAKRSEEILLFRIKNGMICREVPVKETRQLIRSEDENGNKMINEYVRECRIGSGSYGKVVLYRSQTDGKRYAIKAFHKSHLLKLRVAPSETAMTDVLREVLIMKMLSHPNIVNLIEVIDDPNTDHFYMVLEYVEGKWFCEGSGPLEGLGETAARKYLRDVVAGLMYLHAHNIVHGDIKPDNLLVSSTGIVKIADFSVSQVFEALSVLEDFDGWCLDAHLAARLTPNTLNRDNNDELRRSPGTPVFTAPECCLGLTYNGMAADTWAVGVTLYRMVLGHYPFLGDTLQDTYDKIVNNPLSIPDSINPQLKNLVEGLLCKDPIRRMTLNAVAEHPWVVGEEGPIPQYSCWCKRANHL